MAASNSTALAEILGIPSSSSSTAATAPASPSPLANATAATTPTPTPPAQEEDPLQKLTTAAQSVGDYFKAKLGAKASAQPRPKHSSALPAVTRDANKDDDDDAPRAGLGAARLVPTGRLDEPVFTTSKFAAMFARGKDTVDVKEETVDGGGVERAETQDDVGDEEEQRKTERKRAKEERRRERQERRRRKEAKSRAIAEPVAEPPDSALVLELSIGEVQPGHTKMRKLRESDGQLGLLEDNLAPGDCGTVAVQNKKHKKRDKSRKTGRDSNP